jgi:hypothetical protein
VIDSKGAVDVEIDWPRCHRQALSASCSSEAISSGVCIHEALHHLGCGLQGFIDILLNRRLANHVQACFARCQLPLILMLTSASRSGLAGPSWKPRGASTNGAHLESKNEIADAAEDGEDSNPKDQQSGSGAYVLL